MSSEKEWSRLYEKEKFVLEKRVQDLLERRGSDRKACLQELDRCEAFVKNSLREVIQRNYRKFIECANQIESGTQSLLRVKEEVSNLRSTLQQVADLPLDADEGNAEDEFAYDHTSVLVKSEYDEAETVMEKLRSDVDVAIFEHDFDKATELMVKPPPGAHTDANKYALWDIEENLASHIMLALRNTPASSRSLLKLLVKLGRQQAAYDFFLKHRSHWVRSEVRRVRFVGDVVVYAKSVSTAVFRGLAATYAEFMLMLANNFDTHGMPLEAPSAGTAPNSSPAGPLHFNSTNHASKQTANSPQPKGANGQRAGSAVPEGPKDGKMPNGIGASSPASQRMRSTAIRWLATEIDDFSQLIISQIFAVETFSDVFRALAEVFKACRDYLEPLSIDLLPHLRTSLEEPALEALRKEIDLKKQLCLRELDEDDMTQRPGEAYEDIHKPPLWTARTPRNERLSVVVSRSTYCLLNETASLLRNVRAVCLDASDGTMSSSRAGDRPWAVLEDETDRDICELLKEYVNAAFMRTKADRPLGDGQIMMLVSNIFFIINHLMARASDVMRKTFNTERVVHLDHLRDKSGELPDKLLKSLASEWCKAEITVPTYIELLENDAEIAENTGPVVLSSFKAVVHRVAGLRREAMSVFNDSAAADHIVENFTRHILALTTPVAWWMDLVGRALDEADNEQMDRNGETNPPEAFHVDFNPGIRALIICNVLLLMEAFSSYVEQEVIDDFRNALDIRAEDEEVAGNALTNDPDELLDEAMNELNRENREDLPF
ncbi:Exocyst complex component 8 [Diplonema papillatum]|nr:Exocyst complex component 8 [Diplonema papillatum]